jgi:hypothetical protein
VHIYTIPYLGQERFFVSCHSYAKADAAMESLGIDQDMPWRLNLQQSSGIHLLFGAPGESSEGVIHVIKEEVGVWDGGCWIVKNKGGKKELESPYYPDRIYDDIWSLGMVIMRNGGGVVIFEGLQTPDDARVALELSQGCALVFVFTSADGDLDFGSPSIVNVAVDSFMRLEIDRKELDWEIRSVLCFKAKDEQAAGGERPYLLQTKVYDNDARDRFRNGV